MSVPITKSHIHEARALLARGAAVLLDVRTPDEYSDRHIQGAINIPLQELSHRMGEIGRGRAVVVYCRSGARSAAASQMLRAAGHQVLDIGAMHNW